MKLVQWSIISSYFWCSENVQTIFFFSFFDVPDYRCLPFIIPSYFQSCTYQFLFLGKKTYRIFIFYNIHHLLAIKNLIKIINVVLTSVVSHLEFHEVLKTLPFHEILIKKNVNLQAHSIYILHL